MSSFHLMVDPPVPFESLQAGLVALRLTATSQPYVRLVETGAEKRREWLAVAGVVLPRGALLTHITPQPDKVMEPGVDAVEAWSSMDLTSKRL